MARRMTIPSSAIPAITCSGARRAPTPSTAPRGFDTVSYWTSGSGVEVNLSTRLVSGGDAEGDTISGFEGINGSTHADTLIGDGGDNRLFGGDGADRLAGGAGDDPLEGDAGADFLDGGEGVDGAFYRLSDAGVEVNLATGRASGGHAQDDTLIGIEQLYGSSHDDTLVGDGSDNILRGEAGADRLDGGAGFDIVSYRLSDAGVGVNLATGRVAGGHAEGDTISGFEGINGSTHADTLIGDGGDNRLLGRDGADRLDGGVGFDTVSYWDSDAGVEANLATGRVSGGDAEGDTISGFEGLYGSAHADTLIGDSGDNHLRGGAGADRLGGGAGFDIVSYERSDAGVEVNLATGRVSGGDAEGDTISGFEGVLGSEHADTLIGDGGDNRLDGGLGSDLFIFRSGHGADTIGDFSNGEDRIDLTALGVSSFGARTRYGGGGRSSTRPHGRGRRDDSA